MWVWGLPVLPDAGAIMVNTASACFPPSPSTASRLRFFEGRGELLSEADSLAATAFFGVFLVSFTSSEDEDEEDSSSDDDIVDLDRTNQAEAALRPTHSDLELPKVAGVFGPESLLLLSPNTLPVASRTMEKRKISSVLIANRGEIAERVIRTCRRLGIRTVAVHSPVDRNLPFVAAADAAYVLNSPNSSSASADTYLQQEMILDIARRAKVDAIHPGMSFCSLSRIF